MSEPKLQCQMCKKSLSEKDKLHFVSFLIYENELDLREAQFDEDKRIELTDFESTVLLCEHCYEKAKTSAFFDEFPEAKKLLEAQEKTWKWNEDAMGC